ncbi:hypothetical protein J6590_054040 [Homalodisca vitripennis]|nr:hypothetical protein J6590_054040 [Homalodisca vitripennis]
MDSSEPERVRQVPPLLFNLDSSSSPPSEGTPLIPYMVIKRMECSDWSRAG